MQKDDIDTVLRVEEASSVDPWSQGIFEGCIRVHYFNYVLEVDSTIEGFIIIQCILDECHLLNICVSPDEQGQGYGKALLEHCLVIAVEKQCRTVFLEVRVSNRTAINLYQKYQFKEVNRRKNYYKTAEGHEDAIVLQRVMQ